MITSPPTPLLQGEGRRIAQIRKTEKQLLITPPSLQGKGVGGLGNTILRRAEKELVRTSSFP